MFKINTWKYSYNSPNREEEEPIRKKGKLSPFQNFAIILFTRIC